MGRGAKRDINFMAVDTELKVSSINLSWQYINVCVVAKNETFDSVTT